MNRILNVKYKNIKKIQKGAVQFAKIIDQLCHSQTYEYFVPFLDEKIEHGTPDQKEIITDCLNLKKSVDEVMTLIGNWPSSQDYLNHILNFFHQGENIMREMFENLNSTDKNFQRKGYARLPLFYAYWSGIKWKVSSFLEYFYDLEEAVSCRNSDEEAVRLTSLVEQKNQSSYKFLIPFWEQLNETQQQSIALHHYILHEYDNFHTNKIFGPNLSFFIGDENYKTIMQLVQKNHQEELNYAKIELIKLLNPVKGQLIEEYIKLINQVKPEKVTQTESKKEIDLDSNIDELSEKKILFKKMHAAINTLEKSFTHSTFYQHHLQEAVTCYQEIKNQLELEGNGKIETFLSALFAYIPEEKKKRTTILNKLKEDNNKMSNCYKANTKNLTQIIEQYWKQ